jgi:arsenate reductase
MKKILFVCVENSNRSQMAEAFAKIHGGTKVEAYSSGSRPSGIINPKAITAMKELGYDLSSHSSKSLDKIPQIKYDYAITMGCGDECPFVLAEHRDDWKLDDPKNMGRDEFNKVRDEIERRVKVLLSQF